MNEIAKTDLDTEEQMQRIKKTELEMKQINQTMRYATIQLYLTTIGTVVASLGAVITAVRFLFGH